MKKVVGAVLLMPWTFLYAMEEFNLNSKSNEKSNQPIITQQVIIEYKKGFEAFLQNKKNEFNQLTMILKIPFGIGNSIVQWMGGEEVKLEEAQTFLERIFNNEDEFKRIFAKIENDSDNITYINNIFTNLGGSPNNKSKNEMYTAIRVTEHAKVKYPSNMDKLPDQEGYIPDELFLNYAACNLIALHTFDQLTKSTPSPRRNRRRNSKTPLT